jgi:hypothetical protein
VVPAGSGFPASTVQTGVKCRRCNRVEQAAIPLAVRLKSTSAGASQAARAGANRYGVNSSISGSAAIKDTRRLAR